MAIFVINGNENEKTLEVVERLEEKGWVRGNRRLITPQVIETSLEDVFVYVSLKESEVVRKSLEFRSSRVCIIASRRLNRNQETLPIDGPVIILVDDLNKPTKIANNVYERVIKEFSTEAESELEKQGRV